MGVALGPDTAYAKEMRQWEAQNSEFGAAGRPYQFREFPKMLYKGAHVSGQGATLTERVIANDDREERIYRDKGFHVKQEDALAAVHRDHTEYGKLAAERNYEIAHGRVSERAAKEVAAHEGEYGARHMPVVPETPIRTTDKAERMAKARAAKQAKKDAVPA